MDSVNSNTLRQNRIETLRELERQGRRSERPSNSEKIKYLPALRHNKVNQTQKLPSQKRIYRSKVSKAVAMAEKINKSQDPLRTLGYIGKELDKEKQPLSRG